MFYRSELLFLNTCLQIYRNQPNKMIKCPHHTLLGKTNYRRQSAALACLLSFCLLSSSLHQAETEATSTYRKTHLRTGFLLAQQFNIHLKHWKLTETQKLETTYIKICTNKKTSKYIKHCDGEMGKCRTFCTPFMLFLAIMSLFKSQFFPYF